MDENNESRRGTKRPPDPDPAGTSSVGSGSDTDHVTSESEGSDRMTGAQFTEHGKSFQMRAISGQPKSFRTASLTGVEFQAKRLSPALLTFQNLSGATNVASPKPALTVKRPTLKPESIENPCEEFKQSLSSGSDLSQDLHAGCSLLSENLAQVAPPFPLLTEDLSTMRSEGCKLSEGSLQPSEQYVCEPACFPEPDEDFNNDDPYEVPPQPEEEATSNNTPIYPGARISVYDSILSILTFAQTEKLSNAAIGRLLSLIDLHCPEKNGVLKSTSKLFNNLKHLESDYELSYYCSICWRARPSAKDLCTVCTNNKRQNHFFVHFSIENQIKKFFKQPKFVEALKYRQNRTKKSEDSIEDVIDGELYQEALLSFLSNPNNLSLMWYTDGVQLYESTSFSLWPQFFVILELPPDLRYKPEYMLMAGLWGSRDHPHPNIVLRHTVQELSILKDTGFEVEVAGSDDKILVKVCCLCGTCDGPAKAAFMNIKGHAGYYSCPVCYAKGLKSEATDNVMVFPFTEEETFRSEKVGYSELVKESLKVYKKQATKDEKCKGIQGPTLLSSLFSFCMFESCSIDSMHCLYMNVLKLLLYLLFDSKFSKEPFSLHAKLDEVNEILSNIQLPHFAQRAPVQVDKLSFWKASLCVNFFFHLMLPILKCFMAEKYFEHLVLLVNAVALLNSESVSLSDILEADLMLQKFVADFAGCYGVRNMSFNVHLCLHLPRTVKKLGPLWATSCFAFEDFNGKFVSLAHGTSDSLIQISRRFPILTELSNEVGKLTDGPAKQFCEQLTSKWKRYHFQDKISDYTFIVGYFDKTPIFTNEITELLGFLSELVPTFCTFPKVYHRKQLFVASSYTRCARKSSVVKYYSNEGVFYGNVQTFVKAEYANCKYFAYIQRLSVVPFALNDPQKVKHLLKISCTAGYDFVPIDCLQCVCFYVSVHDAQYVSESLNPYEKF